MISNEEKIDCLYKIAGDDALSGLKRNAVVRGAGKAVRDFIPNILEYGSGFVNGLASKMIGKSFWDGFNAQYEYTKNNIGDKIRNGLMSVGGNYVANKLRNNDTELMQELRSSGMSGKDYMAELDSVKNLEDTTNTIADLGISLPFGGAMFKGGVTGLKFLGRGGAKLLSKVPGVASAASKTMSAGQKVYNGVKASPVVSKTIDFGNKLSNTKFGRGVNLGLKGINSTPGIIAVTGAGTWVSNKKGFDQAREQVDSFLKNPDAFLYTMTNDEFVEWYGDLPEQYQGIVDRALSKFSE